MMERIDLNSYAFHIPENLELDLLLTIKSFDLQAIRERYLNSRNQNKKNVLGSVERRAIGLGGLASLSIRNGRLTNAMVLQEMKEPRALSSTESRLAIGAENTVYVLEGNEVFEMTHPWFSYIHTVSFHPKNPDVILVASSGLDCIFELNFRRSEIVWEWCAWEHGMDESVDPVSGKLIKLTRDSAMAQEYIASNQAYLLIQKGSADSLPTARRAAFINSVAYDRDSNNILATLFHKGKVIRINKSTGDWEDIILEMKSPHGGTCMGDKYLATNTAGGEVVIREAQNEIRYAFNHLPNKAPGMEDVEWLQNTIECGSGLMTIDSNRNRLFYFNPEEKKYTFWNLNDDWAVQDLSIYKGPNQLLELVKRLNNPTN